MTVTIPATLIEKLQNLGPHFCLVEKHGKNPSIGGEGWQKPEKLMLYDDQKLSFPLKK